MHVKRETYKDISLYIANFCLIMIIYIYVLQLLINSNIMTFPDV